MKLFTKRAYLLSFFLVLGCSSPTCFQNDFTTSYYEGKLPKAEKVLSETINEEMPAKQYTCTNNASWYLLNRGTIRFASNQIDGAIQDFDLALDAIDYYRQKCLKERALQILSEDGSAAYLPAPYEERLAHLYLALALLEKKDFSNAEAILRKTEESRFLQDCETNPVAKYLFAALLEKRKDFSNAAILYRQAGASIGPEKVAKDLTRLRFPSKTPTASVIVICHNGNAPLKESAPLPASMASAAFLEILLGSERHPPALSTLPGIPAPFLYQAWGSLPQPNNFTLGSYSACTIPWYNVHQAAQKKLEADLPYIVARGVARLLLRRGAVAVASDQDPNLGALADLTCLFLNATTEADTRCWSTLPYSIDLVRLDLPAGQYPLALHSDHCTSPIKSIKLSEGDLVIVNIFNIHPGLTLVRKSS